MQQLDTPVALAQAELNRSYDLADYEAVDVAWVAMIRVANTCTDGKERERLESLLARLNEEAVNALLHHAAIDTLVNLEPPLEALLTNQHEHLDERLTADQVATIRHERGVDPRKSLTALVDILRRIRNRRAHGFKSPYAPRDAVIMGAAAPILRSLTQALIDAAP